MNRRSRRRNAAKARQSSRRSPTPEKASPEREDSSTALAGLEVLLKHQEHLEGRPFQELFPEVINRIVAAEAGMMFFFKREELKALGYGPEYAQQALAALAVARNLITSVALPFMELALPMGPSTGSVDVDGFRGRGRERPRGPVGGPMGRDMEFTPSKLKSFSEEELGALREMLKPSEKAEQARRECGAAMQRYLDAHNTEAEDYPRTQREESQQLVSRTAASLQEQFSDETPLEDLAIAVFQVMLAWLRLSASVQIFSSTPGPIAKALLKLSEPPEWALEQAHKSAAMAMAHATLGPRSEEAVRRAFIAWCVGLGASSKDANNWFRP